MSVKIRLKRIGAKKRPSYRIVISDSRKPRDGRTIEEVGAYHPIEGENQLQLKEANVRNWLDKGARPTPTVKRLLNQAKIYIK